MKRRYLAGLTIVATSLLAACGGGSSGSSLPAIPAAGGTAQSLGFTLSGSSLPLASVRRTASLDGAPVSVTYQGQTVATGTLNGSGFAQLHFTAPVPLGATVTVTVGSGSSAVAATVVLASSVGATAANVVYTPANGSTPAQITVRTAADRDGNGQVDANDNEQETSTENPEDGEIEDVDSADDDHLPTNLPISISVCNGSTITIAPLTPAPAPTASAAPAPSATPLGALTLRIAERVSDGDAGAIFSYVASPFTQPLTFPIISPAARIDIEVDANGQKLVTIEAPLAAFTGSGATAGAPTPGTCPTLSPGLPFASPAPTATPTAAPTGTPAPALTGSPAPTPTGSPV